MNKEEVLNELSIKLDSGEISREEIVDRLKVNTSTDLETETKKIDKTPHFSITKILYILGAVIVIVGISFFVAQIWENIGSFGRILVTFGLGLFLALMGSVLLKQKTNKSIGSVFHAIGGVLIPSGSLVALFEFGFDGDWAIAVTFAVIFIFYIILNIVHKNAILTFFAIANGTVMIYLFLNAIMGGPFQDWFVVKDVYQYLTMAVGMSYLLLAHLFRDGWNKHLVGTLCFFGITGFLGAAFSQIFDSVLWQFFYFFIVLGGFMLSVYMRKFIILVMSAVFLIAHFIFITGEYFANSIGWPVSLIILGFLIIGLGFISVRINKKYIKKEI